MTAAIRLVVADITRLQADVIVNAANGSLCGGGGVDGAIHRAAGPALLAHCRTLGGASVGDVVFTPAFALSARFIAHAVGPVWKGGDLDEEALLAGCYQQALDGAVERGCRSVAFPSISTGAYRFPIDRAARLALTTTAAHQGLLQVTFCLFSASDLSTWKRAAASVHITLAA
jgi:O-acetyl-ADP-ribose deacetylase (regulator of RNase III)